MEYPTPAEINALPEKVRHFIHDLESRCDPAGELQELACLRQNVAALSAALVEARAQLASLTPQNERNAP